MSILKAPWIFLGYFNVVLIVHTDFSKNESLGQNQNIKMVIVQSAWDK